MMLLFITKALRHARESFATLYGAYMRIWQRRRMRERKQVCSDSAECAAAKVCVRVQEVCVVYVLRR